MSLFLGSKLEEMHLGNRALENIPLQSEFDRSLTIYVAVNMHEFPVRNPPLHFDKIRLYFLGSKNKLKLFFSDII